MDVVPVSEFQAFSAARGNFWQENCVLNTQQLLWVPSLLQKECNESTLTYLPASSFDLSAETDVTFFSSQMSGWAIKALHLPLNHYGTMPRILLQSCHKIKCTCNVLSTHEASHSCSTDGSLLPLERERSGSPAPREEGRDPRTGTRGHAWHGDNRCALPCHGAHTHPTRTQHRTRGTSTLELLLILFFNVSQ